ncbi:hypothetical protein DYB32_008077 [Aphanomyces invadans]|uniref:G-protein coupled receptors family 1 profile domain-containing protein n=1 Tax=Aphanomyces invadans TaxID=157072 RepID=A0A418AQE5_9STRA|nr:hypothetical protein DYB32_008077 [Aphanomyces invadans]
MLFFDSVALALSASMTLTACATVFKWKSVRKHATHSTMFMVFLSLGLWSLSTLVRIVLIYTGIDPGPPKPPIGPPPPGFTPPPPPLGVKVILYTTLVTDMFFNATSLWCILATYEFQRWVWRPRLVHERKTLRWYHLFVQACCVAQVVAVTTVDVLWVPPPPPAIRPLGVAGGSPPGLGGPGKLPPPPAQLLMENIFWTIFCVRWVAVLYPVVLGIVLACSPKARGLNRTQSVHVFVLLLVALNVPYLVVEPLFDFGILNKTEMLLLYSVSKFATYCSGVGMVNLLGLYLVDFDVLYVVKDPPLMPSPSAFLVFESNSYYSPATLVHPRR